ncbi:MAG: hypothetical protein A2X79_04160 [Desulfuromonadaceae bacterium GWB2_53_15]|nr:MAG: hypothetical protein A2X79_04160 [Desulfuromonadaceae bacterium GWB2_53_15]
MSSGKHAYIMLIAGFMLLSALPVWADYSSAHTAFLKGEYIVALKKFKADSSAQSCFKLGTMYDNALGVEEDKQEALKWYLKAANQGLDAAQHRIGEMYDNGRGVPENTQEAVKWYRKAAEQGYAIASFKLGDMYYNGRGVQKDIAEGVKWYQQSARVGNMKAQYELGNLYYLGKDVSGRAFTKDWTEAARLYLRSAEQGHFKAQYAIGSMYLRGEGIAVNRDEGIKWLRKAAENGHKRAQAELKGMVK